ncbi:hypothetical protein CRG98_005954 [Punica granatum]|uniref:Uncharacterized protein n=1 Tax=Punica granatum TaxID=22663 RepID=A0A2I0KZE6_PUNGR|nr:hypothetical protein CRG98_005954 [Punica granatum]
MKIFTELEEDDGPVELPWNKVTALFNLARLLEEIHKTEPASLLYRLIVYKYPDYVDAYLRLAAIAKTRNNIQLSIELVNDALKVNDKCANALSMLGDLELKNDDWVKAKETFRAASEATGGKDSYSTLSLGNWNYFAAMRNERRNPKLEATHLEKAKELYTRVRSAFAELKNAVRVFGQLSAAANLNFHGFDEKKIATHAEYCKHLLEAAKLHCEAAQREEEQARQRQELARQVALAEEARRKAEEQRKKQVCCFRLLIRW